MINKLVYSLAYAIMWLLSLLPLSVHYIISDGLYLLVYRCVGYRLKLVRKNLQDSFPEKSTEELRIVERKFYHWLCDYLVETVKLMTMSKEELKKRMVFKGTEKLDAMVNEGRSCAVYLGHYCNWEWIASLPLWVSDKAQCGQIYHPLENKAADMLFLKLRQRLGAVCIPMAETLRRIAAYRRENTPVIIGYISDQVPFWNNIHHWCTFLNHDTPVLTGTERLAKRTNHAVFYMDVTRPKRGYYEVQIEEISLQPNHKADFEITDIYFRLLEKTIQRNPEFWLWTHNRWKRTRAEFNRRFVVVGDKVLAREVAESRQ